MEIDAQTVIDKLTKSLASQNAASLRDNAILESQVEMLQLRVTALETENTSLSNELARSRMTNESARPEDVEGEVIVG